MIGFKSEYIFNRCINWCQLWICLWSVLIYRLRVVYSTAFLWYRVTRAVSTVYDTCCSVCFQVCLAAVFLNAFFTMSVRIAGPIDARLTVMNYPVPIGGVVEMRSVGKNKVAKLRVYSIKRLGWRDVVVRATYDDVPAEQFDPHYAIFMRVSFSDVVLPWQYMFLHPVGWYVEICIHFVFMGDWRDFKVDINVVLSHRV